MTHLLSVERRWECPNCTVTAVTNTARTATPFHPCRGVKGLTAPMVLEGTSCKVVANEREDFVGGDIVQTDGDGRPIMNLITTRDDGTDLTVFAPLASAKAINP